MKVLVREDKIMPHPSEWTDVRFSFWRNFITAEFQNQSMQLENIETWKGRTFKIHCRRLQYAKSLWRTPAE